MDKKYFIYLFHTLISVLLLKESNLFENFTNLALEDHTNTTADSFDRTFREFQLTIILAMNMDYAVRF